VPDQAQLCEALLARLFTDAEFRAEFVKQPERVCREFGLDESSVAAFARSDAVGLELAARSYSHKRNGSARGKSR
jgi:putative modified peptide